MLRGYASAAPTEGSLMRNPPSRSERVVATLARYSGAVGAALSVAAGLYTVTLQDQSAVNGLVIGLLGTAVAFQLEILAKINEKAKRGEDYSSLLRNFEDHPWMLETIATSVAAADECLSETAVMQFQQKVRDCFDHMELKLRQLSQGRLECASGDNSLMMQQYQIAREQVRGLSESADGPWWRSATGRQYLRLNEETARRGIRVQRIFVIDDTLESIQDVIQENIDVGVETYTINKTDVPSDLLVNLTIFDDLLAHEDKTNSVGTTIGYVYSSNPVDIARLGEIFERLRSRASTVGTAASPNAAVAPVVQLQNLGN